MRHLHVIAIEISPVLCQTFVATFDAGVSENHERFGVVPETYDHRLVVVRIHCQFRVGNSQHHYPDTVDVEPSSGPVQVEDVDSLGDGIQSPVVGPGVRGIFRLPVEEGVRQP